SPERERRTPYSAVPTPSSLAPYPTAEYSSPTAKAGPKRGAEGTACSSGTGSDNTTSAMSCPQKEVTSSCTATRVGENHRLPRSGSVSLENKSSSLLAVSPNSSRAQLT